MFRCVERFAIPAGWVAALGGRIEICVVNALVAKILKHLRLERCRFDAR